jgi:hypothetical protein
MIAVSRGWRASAAVPEMPIAVEDHEVYAAVEGTFALEP